MTGVGGTGVVTIGQLLGMAAHLEGKGVVTQDSAGLAQKGGATWSHIQIANRPEAIHTTKVDTAKADLVIACDGIVAAGKATLALMREGRTYVALNSHATPTAAFTATPRTGAPPLAVQFSDASTGGPTAWSWDFGDGSAPSTLQNPSHTYLNPGSYTVTLGVANAVGSDSETGIGALIPWADRLWYVGYVAHIKGSGIGLYAAKRLGESMGAHLWCEPARPNGARFVVALPAAVAL